MISPADVDYKNLFESSPGLYLILTPSLEIIAASNAYLGATMKQREEIIGRQIFEVFPDNPDDSHATGVATLKGSLEKVFSTKVTDKINIQKYDIRRPEKSGGKFEVRYWKVTNTPVLDANNEIKHIIHEVEDITDVVFLRSQAKHDRAAAEQLEHFRLFFESVPGLFLVISPEDGFNILAVSDEFLKTTHLQKNEVVGKRLIDIYPGDPDKSKEEIIEKFHQSITRVIQTGAPDLMGISKLLIRKNSKEEDGYNESYWSTFNSPVFGPDKSIEYIIHRIEDVTKFISEREKEIRENENRLRSIFDNSMDGVLLTKPYGEIMLANKAVTEMFGYTENELQLLGRNALTESDDPQVNAAIEQRYKTGRFRGELTFKCKDGTRIPVEVSSSIFRDENGEKWTCLFVRDITENKKAEKEREDLLRRLDEKKRWMEVVIENAPVAILLIKGSAGETVIPNSCAKKIFGEDVDWAKGKDAILGIVYNPESMEPCGKDQLSYNRALQGETITAQEELLCRRDGIKIPVLVNSGPISDRSGKILGAVTIFQDVEEWKKAQGLLKEANDRIEREKRWLQAVFEGAAISILMFHSHDPEHPVPNAQARKMFGSLIDWNAGRDSYVGFSCDAEGNPFSKDELTSSRILRGETIISEEQLFRFPDGREIPIVVAGAPIYDETGKQMGAVAFFQDISSFKELEHLREEWAAIIAHDLRQPITAIQLSAGILKTFPEINKNMLEISEMIESSAKQLSRMTNDLLDISQLEAHKLKLDLKETDIVKLLDQIVKKLTPVFPANPIILDLKTDVISILVDQGRIEQVIGNLISNASKYGYPQTEIVVKAELNEMSLEIEVINKGPGIEKKDLNKIFQRFHRTRHAKNERIKGVGLGLYITRGLIEAHGGKIIAESIPGQTTTFRIELPLTINKSSE
jgi:PAS domain S-box-containing protein